MSVTTVIKAMIGNLEAITSRIKPRQGVQLRETKIAVLPDPRFTKDQWEKMRALAGSINRPER
jgi:hypothetical protein